MKPWLIIAVIVLISGGWLHGFRTGQSANEAQHLKAIAGQRRIADAMTAMAATAETKRLAAEQSARLLSQALEDQAYAAPPEHPACLPVSRVLRINKR